MKIIEYLAQDGQDTGGTPYARSAQFTVDNTQLHVDADYAIGKGPMDCYLIDDSGHSCFQQYDNFHLIALGISLPMSFEIWSNKCKLRLYYYDDESTPVPLPGLGYDAIILPFANFEIPIDLMFSPKDLGMSAPRRLGAQVVEMDDSPLMISMVGVPDVLNEQVLEVAVFCKVGHNSFLSNT